MNILKKSVLWLLPLLLFAACQKEEVTLKAVIQTFGDEKVHLNTGDYAIFDNGDMVRINGANYPMAVAADYSASVSGVPSSDTYTAIFPARDDDKVVLPQEQTYEEVMVGTEAVQRINAPMAAKDSRVLHFKNLCSLLEVQITSPVDEFDVLSISVTSSNPNAYLYGTYSVNWSNAGVPSLSGSNASSSRGHTVTLNCNRYRIATAGTTKSFYVVLPPFNSNNLASALTVHVQGHSAHSNAANLTGTLFFHNTQQSVAFQLPANKIVTGASIPDENAYTVIPGLEGSGTEWDPYKLYSYNDLFYASSVINSGEIDYITARRGELFRTGCFRVMQDFDCGNNVVVPLGSKNNNFAGTLDGRGEDGLDHTITYNQLADIGGDIGLVGIMANGSNVKNLTVAGNIYVARQYGNQVNVIGGIVGVVKCTDSSKTSQIINCHNTANIHPTEQQGSSIDLDKGKAAHVGGILGSIWVETSGGKVVVDNCSNSGNIEGIVTTVQNSGTGGIVGSRINNSAQLTVSNCINTGRIVCNSTHSTAGAGGILGLNKDSGKDLIVNCENRGEITNASGTTGNKDVSIGGICGYWNTNNSNAFISNCVNHGNVAHLSTTANGYAGGIVGKVANGNCRVKNCYSDGTVSGCADSRRGGILGTGGANVMVGCYYLPTTGTTWASGSSTTTAGNKIGSGEGQTSYSALLGNLNTWVGNNSTATPTYSTWREVSSKPELNSLHPASSSSQRRR